MTSHPGRLYALVAGTVTFFIAWATIAAHPWAQATSQKADPRLTALAARERHLRPEALRVQKVVASRWARYRVELRARRREIVRIKAQQARAARAVQPVTSSAAQVASPSVHVVTLPPLVITRTS